MEINKFLWLLTLFLFEAVHSLLHGWRYSYLSERSKPNIHNRLKIVATKLPYILHKSAF